MKLLLQAIYSGVYPGHKYSFIAMICLAILVPVALVSIDHRLAIETANTPNADDGSFIV